MSNQNSVIELSLAQFEKVESYILGNNIAACNIFGCTQFEPKEKEQLKNFLWACYTANNICQAIQYQSSVDLFWEVRNEKIEPTQNKDFQIIRNSLQKIKENISINGISYLNGTFETILDRGIKKLTALIEEIEEKPKAAKPAPKPIKKEVQKTDSLAAMFFNF